MATILIVEDEQPVRELLAELVEAAGHQPLQARHGREALEVIAVERPDLVLADVMLPILGGIELCRRLKADVATAAIPVVLMSSARVGESDRAVAEAFLAKPFELETLEAILRHWLGDQRAQSTNMEPAG
jgi:CheY-like chemotaxis protein